VAAAALTPDHFLTFQVTQPNIYYTKTYNQLKRSVDCFCVVRQCEMEWNVTAVWKRGTGYCVRVVRQCEMEWNVTVVWKRVLVIV
jgi:hypothetical protein